MIRTVLAILCALSSTAWSQSTFDSLFAPQPIAAPYLFVEQAIGDVEISPNGQFLAVTRRRTSNSEIEIYDVATMEKRGTIPLKGYRAYEVDWASNRRILIRLRQYRTIERGSTTYYTTSRSETQMLSIDLAGGSMLVLFDKVDGFGRIQTIGGIENRLPDDPEHVLLQGIEGGDLHLFKVNVNNGRVERVARGSPNTEEWFTNVDGKPILRLDGGGSTKYWNWRPLSVLYAPDDKGRWQKVRSYSRTRDDEQKRFDLAGRTSSDDFAIFSFEDEDQFVRVKSYNPQTDSFTGIVGALDGMDADQTILNRRTGEIIGVAGWKHERVSRFFDPALNARWQRIEELLGAQKNVSLWSVSDDFSRIVVIATSPTDAGFYHLYDTETDTIRQIFPRIDRVSRRNLGQAEVVSYTSRYGETLSAYVTHPHGVAADQPAPLIVMVHGGPHTRDFFDYNPRIQFLTSRGYRVIQPYFRGSTGKGRSFMEEGYGEWGQKMQDDVADATLFMQNKGLASPENTCIAGGSYGGYAALFGLIKNDDLYACGVAVAAVTDLKRQLRWDLELFGKGTIALESVQATLSTDGGELSLDQRSPVKRIDEITKPLLVVHGEQDWRVPWRFAKDFVARAERKSTPFASLVFEFEGHSGWSDRAEVLYSDCLEDFLHASIGGKVLNDRTPGFDEVRCPGRID